MMACLPSISSPHTPPKMVLLKHEQQLTSRQHGSTAWHAILPLQGLSRPWPQNGRGSPLVTSRESWRAVKGVRGPG